MSDIENSKPNKQIPSKETVQKEKRKRGRPPAYIAEERKKRNCKAQADFRERRTEYIKQLETDVSKLEEDLQRLQQSHRAAADKHIMVKYKNSLLERILFEKGIDVQAELKHFAVSATDKVQLGTPQPMPVPRAQKSKSCTATGRLSKASEVLHLMVQDTRPPSSSVSHTHQQVQPTIRVYPPPPPSLGNHTYPSMSPTVSSSIQRLQPIQSDSWPSTFETHVKQLEQEYNADADMIDDENAGDYPASPGPYPRHLLSGEAQQTTHISSRGDPSASLFTVTQQPYHTYHPLLDTDPFRLAASMQFSTQISYQECESDFRRLNSVTFE